MNTMDDRSGRSATILAERCALVDDEDELCGIQLSDEDILLAFFKDGCDLDGTPLLMDTQCELNPAALHRTFTLH